MIGYLVLLHYFAAITVHARPRNDYNIFDDILQNDPNLNEGFDLDAFRLDQLNLHNYYRSLHGVPTMSRDETLTSQAQEYAEVLAANNALIPHCNLPSCDRHGAGENLAMASGYTTVETNATKSWYDEIWFYDFCNGGNRPGHEGKMVGHFTQLVWKTSTRLGIGYARNFDKTKVYVVARYLEHGNVYSQFQNNVLVPSYILDTYQNNCNEINGGVSEWSGPSECSRSCGGGVQLKTRTCTNPKPSFNGKDCGVPLKAIAVNDWCNKESCTGDKDHRDLQCQARGKNPDGHEFTASCTLYCLPIGGTSYLPEGLVDDGTHCQASTGVCVAGVCQSMPTYTVPTTPPPTDSAGQIVGQYTGTPSSIIWDNIFFTLPNGATNMVITNRAFNNVEIYVGYESTTSLGYNWGETSGMYTGYTTEHTTKGVLFKYKRFSDYSTFKFEGPVQPDSGFEIVLYGNLLSGAADISWSYNAATTA